MEKRLAAFADVQTRLEELGMGNAVEDRKRFDEKPSEFTLNELLRIQRNAFKQGMGRLGN